ncbi:recombinase family protein [Lysinibacillus fusiformis]|uniref:recombinase family protein n=1 Tax=Lysinibacillus fusiformis TaxID=28031 RepID=UPI00196863D7|nr:recombinase family protein [Lysinibacillus fusiformis]QSB11700.1 recombinase family protein [Lysinibacillus fusiformis]
MSQQVSPKKVAIYARVSTTEQAEEGYSIDEQIRVLKEFCEKEGYGVYDEYVDRGISGKNITGRPAIKRLLADAEQKKFDIVLVWKMNRLARKSLDLMNIVEQLNSKNIAFRSYTEKYETETPTGKLHFQMMAAIAEYERNNIAENVKMGMIARAKDGQWNGGQVMGYDVVEKDSENKKRKQTGLQINEQEAKIIRLIFQMYTTGHGYKAIANKINQDGYRTKKNKTFSLNAIKTIVTNPVYAGYIRYNVRRDWNEKRRNNINPNPIIVKGEHPSIISEETWKIAQKVYKERSCKPNRIHEGVFPLTGIMRCPQCGAGMVIGRTTNRTKSGVKRVLEYYVCGAWKNKGTVACRSNAVRTEYADDYVLNKLEALMKSEHLTKKLVDNINTKQQSLVAPLQREYEQYLQELERYKKKSVKLLDAFTDEVISKEVFQRKSRSIEETMTNLKAQMEPLQAQMQSTVSSEVTYEKIRAIMRNFHQAFTQALTREQRKRLLHLLIHQITIDESREIESIQIKLNDEVLEELQLGVGEMSEDISSTPFSVLVAI